VGRKPNYFARGLTRWTPELMRLYYTIMFGSAKHREQEGNG